MYHYEHINGTVVQVENIVVDMAGGPEAYFAGPFVKKWWLDSGPDQPPGPDVPEQAPEGRDPTEIMSDLVDPAMLDIVHFIMDRVVEDKLTKPEICCLAHRLLVVMIQSMGRPADYGVLLSGILTMAARDLDRVSILQTMLNHALKKDGPNEKT